MSPDAPEPPAPPEPAAAVEPAAPPSPLAAPAVALPPVAPPPAAEATPFTVRRAVEKVGRNDPCHCGSGKKYKKCCLEKDRARLADPSPYAGLTMAEAKGDPARTNDPAIFLEMTAEELRAVDRAPLSPILMVGLMEACADKDALDLAAQVIDELEARGTEKPRDLAAHRDWLVYQALVRGQVDLAHAQADKRRGDETFESQLNKLSLSLTGELPKSVGWVETFLRELLDDAPGLIDVADAISLAGLPGLALSIARAAAAIRGGGGDRAVLEDILFSERERLGLDDEDPALWLLDRPGAKVKRRRRRGAEELEAVRARLAERESAILRMQSERDRLAAELEARRLVEEAQASAAPASAVESEESRRLRRKVEELQAELREKQQERLELSRKLRAQAGSSDGEAVRERPRGAGEATVDLADEGEPLPDEEAALRPVRFTDAFYESAEATGDGRLLLRAQEIAVRFAALDPAAWKQAKKMQDLQNVYTLRVGIHHRLFVVRNERSELLVRELVTRESFDRALKRYRRYEF